MTFCGGIVNNYRAMRGNRSELALGRNSPQCHVNTPPVRNLGVLFDRNLKFDAQITKNMLCRLLLFVQYKIDQEILNVGFNQMFGSYTGNGACRLL